MEGPLLHLQQLNSPKKKKGKRSGNLHWLSLSAACREGLDGGKGKLAGLCNIKDAASSGTIKAGSKGGKTIRQSSSGIIKAGGEGGKKTSAKVNSAGTIKGGVESSKIKQSSCGGNIKACGKGGRTDAKVNISGIIKTGGEGGKKTSARVNSGGTIKGGSECGKTIRQSSSGIIKADGENCKTNAKVNSSGIIKAGGEGGKTNAKVKSSGIIKAGGEGGKTNAKVNSSGTIKADVKSGKTNAKVNSSGIIKAGGENCKTNAKVKSSGIIKAGGENCKTNSKVKNSGIIKADVKSGKTNAKVNSSGIINAGGESGKKNAKVKSSGIIKAGGQGGKTNAKVNSSGTIKADVKSDKTNAKVNSSGIIKAGGDGGKTNAKVNSSGIIKAGGDGGKIKADQSGIIKAVSKSGSKKVKADCDIGCERISRKMAPSGGGNIKAAVNITPNHEKITRNKESTVGYKVKTVVSKLSQTQDMKTNVATMTRIEEDFDLPPLLPSFATSAAEFSTAKKPVSEKSLFAASREPCQKAHKHGLRKRMRQVAQCSQVCCQVKADFYCIDCDRPMCRECCQEEHGDWLPHRLLQWNSTMYGQPREEPEYLLHCCNASAAAKATADASSSELLELVSQSGLVLARLAHCQYCSPLEAMHFLGYLPLSVAATTADQPAAFISTKMLHNLHHLQHHFGMPAGRAVSFLMKLGTAKLFGRCSCRLVSAVAERIQALSVMSHPVPTAGQH